MRRLLYTFSSLYGNQHFVFIHNDISSVYQTWLSCNIISNQLCSYMQQLQGSIYHFLPWPTTLVSSSWLFWKSIFFVLSSCFSCSTGDRDDTDTSAWHKKQSQAAWKSHFALTWKTRIQLYIVGPGSSWIERPTEGIVHYNKVRNQGGKLKLVD